MKLLPVLGPLLVLSALSACTLPARPIDKPIAAPSPAAGSPPAPAPSGTPASGVVDCGVHALPQGKGLPETAMRCVIDAAAGGRQARLQESRLTIEGDPIFTSYLVRTDGVVEVTRDTTKDRYGTPGISTETCTGPVARNGMLTFTSCEPS